MCAGLAQMDGRTVITAEDVCWVVQSGHYACRPSQQADTASRVGYVHGLAVYGSHQGALLDIEAVVTPGDGCVTVTGIVEEEELGQEGHRMRRKSTARGSAENVRTLLAELGYPLGQRNLHINFPGGSPVDGPSAGAAMALVAISALTGRPVDGNSAVTGEITVQGFVKPVGGVPSKVEAARQAGLQRVFIPRENVQETAHITGIEVISAATLQDVLNGMLLPAEAVVYADQTSGMFPELLPAAALGESVLPAATAPAAGRV